MTEWVGVGVVPLTVVVGTVTARVGNVVSGIGTLTAWGSVVTDGGRTDTTPDASLPLSVGTVVVSLSLIAGVLCALDVVVGLFGQTVGSLEAGVATEAVGVADFLHGILTTFS